MSARIPEYYDLHGLTAVVMGLGVHGGGLGTAQWLWNHGADLIVTDLRTESALKKSINALRDLDHITYVLGRHDIKDFQHADLVVKNPGVPNTSPLLKEARLHRVPIVTDISLFMERCRAPIIGITGTRGKTSTTRWIHHLIQQWKNVELGGNLGISPLSFVDRTDPVIPVVLELSSWQCEGLAIVKKSPHIAVLTTLFPDHMNTYRSLQAYAEAKWEIVRYQSKEDIAILNDDDPIWSTLLTKRPIASTIFRYSLTRRPPRGGYLDDSRIVLVDGARHQGSIPLPTHVLLAPHQISNLIGAVTTAWAFGMPIPLISRAMETLPTIPYRLEKRRVWKGITFVNDTTSTIPDSTILAIQFTKDPLVLIAGGSEKNLDFTSLAETIIARRLPVVFFEAPASHRLAATISDMDPQRTIRPLWATSMKDAVTKAIAIAPSNATVLLSPACASFGMFAHEFDRGDQFNEIVSKLPEPRTARMKA